MRIDNAMYCIRAELQEGSCKECEMCNSTGCKSEAFQLALTALAEKNEREENRYLTLNDMKYMIGEPIWSVATAEWLVLASVEEYDCLKFTTCELNYEERAFYKYRKAPSVIKNRQRAIDLLDKFANEYPEVITYRSGRLDMDDEDVTTDVLDLLHSIFDQE